MEGCLIFEIAAGSIGDSAESKDSDCANKGLVKTRPMLVAIPLRVLCRQHQFYIGSNLSRWEQFFIA